MINLANQRGRKERRDFDSFPLKKKKVKLQNKLKNESLF